MLTLNDAFSVKVKVHVHVDASSCRYPQSLQVQYELEGLEGLDGNSSLQVWRVACLNEIIDPEKAKVSWLASEKRLKLVLETPKMDFNPSPGMRQVPTRFFNDPRSRS